jgi:hypothetical protein
MRFDIYGQRQLDVIRDGMGWKVYEVGAGTRVLLNDVIIPADVDENDISTFLDDLFHELARPGKTIRRIA